MKRQHREISPWSVSMRWHDLLFAHWPIDAELLRRCLPRTIPPLELETFDGDAWLGIVPFRMSGIRWRGLPAFPGTSAFPELNVRTYVRAQGQPGVWFFSLDAGSRLAVRVARWTYHLPYYDAQIACTTDARGVIRYQSRRTHRNGGIANLDVEYAGIAEPFSAQPGSFEHWLTERYRLFAGDSRGRLWRGEIQHVPWPLQRAEANFKHVDMTSALGFQLPEVSPHLLFARELAVNAWRLVPA